MVAERAAQILLGVEQKETPAAVPAAQPALA
jgi:hypothetical protein